MKLPSGNQPTLLQCCHLAYCWLRHRTSAFVLWPTLPTFAAQEVGSYLGYTGRAANVVATAARDPIRTFGLIQYI